MQQSKQTNLTGLYFSNIHHEMNEIQSQVEIERIARNKLLMEDLKLLYEFEYYTRDLVRDNTLQEALKDALEQFDHYPENQRDLNHWRSLLCQKVNEAKTTLVVSYEDFLKAHDSYFQDINNDDQPSALTDAIRDELVSKYRNSIDKSVDSFIRTNAKKPPPDISKKINYTNVEIEALNKKYDRLLIEKSDIAMKKYEKEEQFKEDIRKLQMESDTKRKKLLSSIHGAVKLGDKNAILDHLQQKWIFTSIDKYLSNYDADGYTPVHLCCLFGKMEILKLFIEQGFKNVNLPTYNIDGYSCLHLAAQSGEIGIVRLLLEKGANPNQVSKNGRVPLHMATFQGHEMVTSILISNGADPNFGSTDGRNLTPLHNACQKGFAHTVERLLDFSDTKPHVKDASHTSALMLSIQNGQESCIRAFHNAGVHLPFENYQTIRDQYKIALQNNNDDPIVRGFNFYQQNVSHFPARIGLFAPPAGVHQSNPMPFRRNSI